MRRPDDLKKLVPQHDGIVFDDVSFRAWSVEDTICLLDSDQPRSLPARYSDSFVPADVPMVFTTNVRPKKIFPRGRSAAQRRALKRRYVAIEVMGPLTGGRGSV